MLVGLLHDFTIGEGFADFEEPDVGKADAVANVEVLEGLEMG